nr:DUF485 domain-containing protein [Solicola gregarius]
MTDELPTTKHEAYVRVFDDPDFKELRKRYSTFVVPMTIAFLVWYFLYVVCSNWAPDFMSTKVVGNINIALVFGLLQFVTTFVIAYLYAQFARTKLDPLATRLREQFDEEVGK